MSRAMASGARAALALALAVALASPSQAAGLAQMKGVNIEGAEANGDKLPGRLNFDFIYPSEFELNSFASEGMNVIRLPVLWERLQPDLAGGLAPEELQRLRTTVGQATRRHMDVVIDIHNYGSYRERKIGEAAVPTASFARFWGSLASAFKNQPGVDFGLMNEPKNFTADGWRDVAQAALSAIRATGARNMVLVPGANWDNAYNFVQGDGKSSNAASLITLDDPARNLVFEVHQYLDPDNSGTKPVCRDAEASVATLRAFTEWLRARKARGFMGEFGVGPGQQCLESLDAMLRHFEANADVWLGWTYWAAGAWWGDYPFSIEPRPGAARPQIDVLRRYLRPAKGHADAG